MVENVHGTISLLKLQTGAIALFVNSFFFLPLSIRWSSGTELDGKCWTKPDGAGQARTLGFRSVAAIVIVVVADVDVAVLTFRGLDSYTGKNY
jgi:hypothetical protein